MQISFFEEFPTKENLEKLKFIDFQVKLYLAAKSLAEFKSIKRSIKNKHVKEITYWPVLAKKEGYWFSAYSNRSGLRRVLGELKNSKIAVMLDLELPTSHNIWLYLTQKYNFFGNKRIIREFIENYQGRVYASEYFPNRPKWFSLFGLHFKNTKVIKMLYHSMHDFSQEFMENYCKKNKVLGFGTIATGILGTEKILAPEQLKEDLFVAKDNKVEEVVIFRLGGLNEEYNKIIKPFT